MRCYPALVQLHILSELEMGYEICNGTCKSTDTDVFRGTHQTGPDISSLNTNWDHRLSVVLPSHKQRAKILSVRRTIFELANKTQNVAETWLSVCKSLRQIGRFETAMIALRHAELQGLSSEDVLLEQCHILRETGNMRKALFLLEPGILL